MFFKILIVLENAFIRNELGQRTIILICFCNGTINYDIALFKLGTFLLSMAETAYLKLTG